MDSDFSLGIFLGAIIGAVATFMLVVIITSGGPTTRYIQEDDGSSYVCFNSKAIVIKDAETDHWFTPTGILLHLCK